MNHRPVSVPVEFANRTVGDGHPCFVTFEAGPTHAGYESALRLCRHARESGADAVKFQILDPDRLVADRKMPFTYEVLVDRQTGATETVSEPLYDILCRRSLEREEWRALKTECDAMDLAFFATVSFDDEISFLEELRCDSIKIASADVNHYPLLRTAARSGMCIQLDTGNATLGEIEGAVDVIRSEGNEKIIIHQCPSGYPARLESINLRIIQTLRQMFPYPIAFSDHTPGRDMDVAAVTMGAAMVEKTITEDRTTRSVEHIMSLEPRDMKAFVDAIRDLEVALGATRRVLQAAELEKRTQIRRSAFLRTAAARGARLAELDIDFRRPGHGIAPDVFETLADRSLGADVAAGHMLRLEDLA